MLAHLRASCRAATAYLISATLSQHALLALLISGWRTILGAIGARPVRLLLRDLAVFVGQLRVFTVVPLADCRFSLLNRVRSLEQFDRGHDVFRVINRVQPQL